MTRFTISPSELAPFLRFAQRLDSPNAYMRQKSLRCAADCRIFAVCGGRAELLFAQEATVLCENDLIFIPPAIPYHISPCEKSTEVIGLNFDLLSLPQSPRYPIPPVLPEEFSADAVIAPTSVLGLEELSDALILRGRFELCRTICGIREEFSAHRLFAREICGSLLKEVLLRICRAARGASTEQPCRIVDRVIELIRREFCENLTNEIIAKRLNYHPNYINRLMLRHTGRSLHQYLLHFRLERAIELLHEGELSVAEVAEQTGFGDQQQFSHFFRKKTGYPPTEFRNVSL